MEIKPVVAQSSTFDHQQVAKNKRKKFNPKYMLTNSSSDDDESSHTVLRDDDQDQIEEGNQSSNDGQHINSNEVIMQISKASFSITKEQRSSSSTPPTPSNQFLTPSKLSLLQSFNLQQQQQMLQQAAINAIAPQLSQQLVSATNLNETKAKFREFAFKTMQELLNIYGLPLPPNEIIDAMNNVPSVSSQVTLEPPTPPKTPLIISQSLAKSAEKNYNNNNDEAEENYEGNLSSRHIKSNRRLTRSDREYEKYPRRSSQFCDDTNMAEHERGGRESVVSESLMMTGLGTESDPEESDCASSFDSSKLSLKNIENFLDKSPMSFYNPMMHLNTLQSDQAEKQLIAEYSKYLTKYQSYVDCHSEKCQSENQREHYHCYDIQCYNKVLNKKEEIIRHLKWHKKRSESLNHGFTSSDDCTIQFGYCQHNRKQTHYHCIRNKCDKTYISTSDVQMHSNYHRKDSAIYQEGFQRYRATEKCLVQHCNFYGQCTTHFHCRRCKYTFKNKADMEKHKTYHMKDEQLLKDGFKKFLKTEPCRVEGCRFTMICNHIHCVRTNCSFVLHSSGQLLSHKRKHERMDAEMAYRRFKMGDTAKDLTSSELAALQSFHGLDLSLKPPASQELNQFPVADQATTEKFNKLLNNATLENLNALLSHTVASTTSVTPELLKEMQKHQKKEHCRLSDRGLCKHDCDQNAAENVDNLEDGIPKSVIPNVATSSDETKSPSAEEIEQIISQYFTDQCTMQQLTSAEPLDLKTSSNKLVLECFMFKNESHLHCLITGCEAVVPHTLQDISEHLRMHELNQDNIIQNSNLLQITSIEGFFNRKRGRPPKNRVVEVYNNTHLPPQAIFTSFKLERNEQKNQQTSSSLVSQNQNIKVEKQPSAVRANCLVTNIEIVQSTEQCSDSSCVYKNILHYHCSFSKFCHFSTNQLALIDQHLSEFHTKMVIQENYDYFDRNYDCKLNTCSNNKITSHYHCLLCNFSFSMPLEMSEHICEENIEENYESFDVIENDIMKARALPSNKGQRFEQNLTSCNERSLIEQLQENLFQSKVALNSDVDLIKTTKIPFALLDSAEDEKVSVVRAAGTWVPHGSSNFNTSSIHEQAAKEVLSQSVAGPSSSDDTSCDRPFCKLKRRKHEHCDLCNQGFTDNMKLKIHYLKHQHTKLGGIPYDSGAASGGSKYHHDAVPHDLSKSSQESAELLNTIANTANSAFMMDGLSLQNLQLAHLAHFYQQNSLYYQNLYPFLGSQAGIAGSGIEPKLPLFQFPATAAALTTNGSFDFTGMAVTGLSPNTLLAQKRTLEQFEDSHSQKRQKTSERPREYQKKSYKDDSVPKGYLKFRFNQDCGFSNCGYRNHQSHFHCIRKDCFYSFCDKTRFVQHTARHERLDKLMGDDFKQFRANLHCGVVNCAYNKNLGPHNKSSHFHCLKCNYICSDTNKVVAHRRQHSKQEYIKLAGFRKYSSNEPCENSPDGECPYTLKQNHFHCLVCSVGVLSRNQLSHHNHRILPGMPNFSEDMPMLGNENGLVILDDNGSEENFT